jgi:exoribonuclease R
MTDTDDRQHRSILKSIARRAMLERGLLPDFSLQALAEFVTIHGPATRAEESTRDLRNLIWCSIDNDDSRDLNQLTVAEAMPGGAVKILVAIADVERSSRSSRHLTIMPGKTPPRRTRLNALKIRTVPFRSKITITKG